MSAYVCEVMVKLSGATRISLSTSTDVQGRLCSNTLIKKSRLSFPQDDINGLNVTCICNASFNRNGGITTKKSFSTSLITQEHTRSYLKKGEKNIPKEHGSVNLLKYVHGKARYQPTVFD